jgi:hypothetical protein
LTASEEIFDRRRERFALRRTAGRTLNPARKTPPPEERRGRKVIVGTVERAKEVEREMAISIR